MWSEILVIVCSLVAIFLLVFKADSGFKQLRFYISVSVLCVLASFIPVLGLSVPEIAATEWTKIIGISFVLLVFAIIIRHFKPLYARYPFAFSFIPLLIIIVYPFITDADVLKDLLNQILQGGALLISLILYLSLGSKLKNHLLILAGILLFSTSYGLYWFGDELPSVGPWLWQTALAVGVIVVSYIFIGIFRFLNEGEARGEALFDET